MSHDTTSRSDADPDGKKRRFPYGVIIPVVLVVVIAIIVTVVLVLTHGAVSPPSPVNGPPSNVSTAATPGHDR